MRLVGAGTGLRGKGTVVGEIGRAGAVLLEELGIGALELGGIAPAQRNRELTPFVVRVNRNQGVVQVEQGQAARRAGITEAPGRSNIAPGP